MSIVTEAVPGRAGIQSPVLLTVVASMLLTTVPEVLSGWAIREDGNQSNRQKGRKHKVWGPSKTLSRPLLTSLLHARCALVINASDALGVSRWYAIYSTRMGNFKMVFFNRLATKCCQKTKIVQAILRPNSKFYPASPPSKLMFMNLRAVLCLTF